ncbi:MAG: PAS domain-containing protein [Acidobacteriota bacterium]
MNAMLSPPALDPAEEISVLIASLHDIERRLEQLTGGEVDAVSDASGHAFMLRRAQEQLRESEAARHAAILNALPVNIALIDTQGVIVSVNETWRRFARARAFLDAGSGLGFNYLEICDNARGEGSLDAHQVAAGIRAVLDGGIARYSYEYSCGNADEVQWFLLTVTPLISDDRRGGAVIRHVDITEQKLSEQEASRALERLNDAQRIAQIGDWEFDIAREIVTWSPEVFKILGRDPELGPPSTYDEIALAYDPPSRALMAEKYGLAVSSGEVQEYELLAIRPDGQQVHVQIIAAPSPDERGNVSRVHGTIQDISARKRARVALQESEAQLKETQRLACLGSWQLDFNSGTVLWSDETFAIFGLKSNVDAPSYSEHAKLFTADSFSRLELAIRKLREQGTPFELELEIISPEHSGWILCRGEMSLDEAGIPRWLRGTALDITERKRTEIALRESDEKFRQLADNITDVFWIRSPDMQEVLYLSPAFKRIWGRSVESLLANPERWLEFIVPEDRKRVWSAFRDSLQRDAANLEIEYRIARPDGEVRWVFLRGSQVRDASGNVTRNLGVVSDITGRKQSEIALLESARAHRELAGELEIEHARLVTAQRVAQMGSWDLNLATLSMIWSDETHRIYETDPWAFEATYAGFRDLVHPDDRESLDESFGRSLADDSPSAVEGLPVAERSAYALGHRVLLPGGRIKFVEERWTVLHDDHGTPVRALGSCQDVTERWQSEMALRKRDEEYQGMEAQLRQAQKMEAVGELAAGVAHEFNNLLQALMSMATITRLRAGVPEIVKLGSEMETQIRRGARLIHQLMLFSRQTPLQKTELDVQEQVDKTSALLRRFLPENISMLIETSPEKQTIEGDAGQIQQILLNLSINARDAMPDGGTLTLRSGRVRGEVFLEVQDTGVGMDEATVMRIFEPFFTTKAMGKGTGLGLAVAYGIVEQHGGRIDVHSRAGEGSRFRILLPAVFRESLPVSQSTNEPEEMTTGGGRVLLVEDEEAVREGIIMLLEMIGYDVTVAVSAEEALVASMESPPDILLADITLPGLSGLALGEQLCDRWPSLKVILMSGYAEEPWTEGSGRPDWQFLQKPFELADLARKLAAARGEKSSESLEPPVADATSLPVSLAPAIPGWLAE